MTDQRAHDVPVAIEADGTTEEKRRCNALPGNLSLLVAMYAWVCLLSPGGWSTALVYAEPPQAQEERAAAPFVGELFVRTELYFGSLKPDNSHVTKEDFEIFVDGVITPRFPEGLTLLTALGQFRNASGVIQERSRLLILLYPVEDRQDKSKKIETIRRLYKERFQQESVLRVDRCCEQVGF
jgi:hypothetical protein